MPACRSLRRPLAGFTVALFALLISTLPVLAAVRGPYAVEVRKNVMVPMRDGVKLATDVYLPVEDGDVLDGKLPTILERRPYNKNGCKTSGMYYASHGYAFVAQDTRGRYASEGVWHMLTDDGRDGVDTAAWIGEQAWSNAKIGMIGTSYVGGTQHALAMEKPPELKTVIPVDAMSNLGYASMRNGGAFELRFWNWIYLNAGKGSRQSHDAGTAAVLKEMAENRMEYLKRLPLRKGMTPLKLAAEYEDWLVAGMQHGANDDFWIQNNIIDYPEKYKDIPVYLVSGWYDSWSSNNTANFQVLSKTIKGPVYMIMGPWIHGQQGSYSHGQVTFGKAAAIADPLGWRKEWYDHWLKGKENSVGKAAPFQTPVRIFVMGTGDGAKTVDGKLNHGGYWRNEQEWPLKRTVYTKFHLQPEGGLGTSAPEVKAAKTSLLFDPDHPVPTIGGNISSGNDILVQGGWDQKGNEKIWNFTHPTPLSARDDVLVFQTAPLKEDLEVTGELAVKLWISSSAKDTDFTAKLVDVYPPSSDFPGGFDLNIGDGIIRTRFRDSLKEEKLMKPGEIYPVTIKLYPTSNVFKKGHRIRVDISSSNFPRFDVNPNTGEPLNDNRLKQTAINTVYHDAAHPSHILLPVIPKAE
ncbi:Cocaine esterase [Gimesia panareensis]|uniref:Cocaine esterase n=1 Tax=Gimesia panareensis TaxID=2527978 RepID=A0A518FQH8_9PLAN|nr:CocE/NonD family hydrolase [Gimesia panareensis]QDV18545.1 Cocaine esterase [Gimesia panareensis]